MSVHIMRANIVETRRITPETIHDIGDWMRAVSWNVGPDTRHGYLTNMAGDVLGPQIITYHSRFGPDIEAGLDWYIVKVFGRFLAFGPDEFETHFDLPASLDKES